MGQQKQVIIGETAEEKEGKIEPVKKVKAKPEKARELKPLLPKQGKPKVRSQRYQKLYAATDRSRVFSLEEAVPKIKELARAGFDETIELHIRLKLKKGDKSLKALGADKTGNLHAKVGKISEDDEKIIQNIEAILAKISRAKIKKAVLCSTMSPSLKLTL